MVFRKNSRSLIILAVLGIISLHVSAQTPATKGLEIEKAEETQNVGKTYALIVGISKYEYPECYPTLHYADVDAKAFYNYMVSKTGGNVDPSNIDTLYNAGATQQDFWKKFNSIKNRLQKDDNFYIYFSGHGDAISSDLAFLLTYNAPPGNDRNNYYTTGGVVDIHALKSLIKMITLDKNKPAHVILITDACRSNELPPGKEEGRQQFYDEMYTKNAGEVQLVSCLANQVSFEDAKWGGGRGLFSWHLVNGLVGMADNKPEDGVVTVKELINYVTDKVQDDSYDPVTKKYKQTPDYCCRDKDNVVLAKVDKPTKDHLAELLKKGSAMTSDMPTYAANKGVNLGEEMNNEGLGELYKQFRSAIDENRLVDPKDDNAMDILQQILAKNIKPELKSDLKFELSSRLMNDVTAVINNYLHSATNNNSYTFTYFNTAIRKLKAFQSISDTLYYNQLDVKVNLLFLEGHSNWLSTKSYELKECLKKADSAVKLKPKAAYLYYLKGLIQLQLKEYKGAKANYEKAMALAPNWSYPYNDMGNLYTYTGKPDSGLVFLFKGSAIDTNDQTFYGNIAWVYSSMGKTDSEIYYIKKGLTKDPTDFHIWVNLGYTYYRLKKWDSALYCFYKGMHYDSTYYNSYEGALQVHIDHKVSNDSITYYIRKMISSDKDNPAIYKSLGSIFQKYDLDSLALQMYDRALAIDSMSAETWELAYTLCEKLKKYDQAEKCLKFAISIDSTANNDRYYNLLGNFYFKYDYNRKALEAFDNAIKVNPDVEVYYNNYAYVALYTSDTASAEKYYRKAIKSIPDASSSYMELSKILTLKKNNTEALKMLDKAIKHGSYKRNDIENESAFSELKETKEFREIIKKMKE